MKNPTQITFADCWRELKIAYFEFRADHARTPQAAARHTMQASPLRMMRKPCMAKALKEMGANV